MRQLQHSVERAVLLAPGPLIERPDLGPELAPPDAERPSHSGEPELPLGPLKRALEGPESRLVERALEASGGSRQRAAAILGINRTTLFNKMKKYKLLSFPTRLDPEAGGRPRP